MMVPWLGRFVEIVTIAYITGLSKRGSRSLWGPTLCLHQKDQRTGVTRILGEAGQRQVPLQWEEAGPVQDPVLLESGQRTGPQLWDHCGLHQRVQERFTLAVPSITGTRKAIKSFLVEGPRLFNSLPRDLRNLDCKLGTLKAHLDSYLETQPPPAASLEP